MYHPTTRVLTVLELLQSRGSLSGPELATRLEVDVRTVRRYVTMLQELGIPVEATRGRAGAYRLRPGYKLPPLMFTEDEALALTLGLLAARRIGLVGTLPAVEGALAKVNRVLPVALAERVRAVQATLMHDVPEQGGPATSLIATLSTAIQQQRRTWLRYRAYDETVTEREVDPYGLVYEHRAWYLAAHCHLRGAPRMFRVDRIGRAELRDASFEPPPDFDSAAFVLRSLALMPAAWSIDVLLLTSLEEAQCRVSPSLATIEETADGVVMRCTVNSLDWFAAVLAGLECPFLVREPEALRDALRRLADRLVNGAAGIADQARESGAADAASSVAGNDSPGAATGKSLT